jgi:hypothetical protein
MTHLIDKNLVERANTVLLLAYYGLRWRFACSGRWPMTFSIGSKVGETAVWRKVFKPQDEMEMDYKLTRTKRSLVTRVSKHSTG